MDNRDNKHIERGFNIMRLSTIVQKHENKEFDYTKTVRANEFNIFVITIGFGQHIIDFKKYDFNPGVFLFISKNQTHSFDFKPGNEGYVISFTEEYLKETINSVTNFSQKFIFNHHFKKPVIQVVAKEQEYFITLIERVFQAYSKEQKDDEIIQALLNLLILNLERIKTNELFKSSNIQYLEIFVNFKNLLEIQFNKTRNAKDYAQQIGVSYKHLNKICKIIIGKTAKQFIDDYVILEAKRTLIISDESTKKISDYLGFDEATNFIKYFKKHTKLSPVAFKNKIS